MNVPITRHTTAFTDEAGHRGFSRKIDAAMDHQISLFCSIPILTSDLDAVREQFQPHFEKFKAAAPKGAKLHVTDAFIPGNEAWGKVTAEVRNDMFRLMLEKDIYLIYVARRFALERESFENSEAFKEAAKASAQSTIKIDGANRPSDECIEDNVMVGLAVMLDTYAEVVGCDRIDLLFDQIDKQIAKRYSNALEATRKLSNNQAVVGGWNPENKQRVSGTITMSVEAPFRLNSAYLGTITVVGKDDPLIFLVDIVANSLWRHLSGLPHDAPLHEARSVNNWDLANVVWGKNEDRSSFDNL